MWAVGQVVVGLGIDGRLGSHLIRTTRGKDIVTGSVLSRMGGGMPIRRVVHNACGYFSAGHGQARTNAFGGVQVIFATYDGSLTRPDFPSQGGPRTP